MKLHLPVYKGLSTYYITHWRIQDFRLGGRSSEYRGAEGVGFGEAVPPLQKIFGFFCLGMVHFACILTHD